MLSLESCDLPGNHRGEQPVFQLRKAISLFGLASGVVYLASDVTIETVGSYPTFSPLPQHNCGCVFSVALAVSRIYRNPGYYPAPCSLKFGLSSLAVKPGEQLPGPSYSIFLYFYSLVWGAMHLHKKIYCPSPERWK